LIEDPAVIQIFSIDSLPGSTKKPCWVYLTDTILTIKTKIHPADPDKYTVSLDGTTLVNTAIVTGTLREGNVIDLSALSLPASSSRVSIMLTPTQSITALAVRGVVV